jgi:UMF1 family MFS transporter
MLERLGLHRRELRAWAYYDVANSAFMTTVLMVFPLYFTRVPAADLAPQIARARFAFATSLAVVLVGLAGPFLGAIADFKGSKKAFLAAFLALGVAATAGLFFVTRGHWVFGLSVFVLANVGATSTLAFYNALLPGIASRDEVDRVSTAGFALGYLGGGLLFAVNIAVMASPKTFGLADAATATRVAFLSVAVWWAAFSIPLFRAVPEPPVRLELGESAADGVGRVAVRRLLSTVRELRTHYRDAGVLLLAFLIYNDAINTIIRMATTYGDELRISQTHMMLTLLMVQLVGVPFAFAFGLLADRIGAKRSVYVALAVYSGIAVYGFVLRTPTQFLVLGFLVATVQGGAQALGRSLFASLIPRHKAGEMFGLFGVFDRFGGAIGAFVFGVVLQATGSSRPAILALIVFFAVGIALLSRVDVARGRRVAMASEALSAPPPPPLTPR